MAVIVFLIIDNHAIAQPIIIPTTENVSCHGGDDGLIDIAVFGGVSPYSFNWTLNGNYFSSDSDLISLSAGEYCVTVIDSGEDTTNLCVYVFEPPAMSIDGQVEQIDCYGNCNGKVTVNGQGGVPGTSMGELWDYQYRLYSIETGLYSLWQNENTFEDLCPGNYNVEVIDYNGCISSYPDFTINEPSPVGLNNFFESNLSCNGANDGFINVSILGGVSGNSVYWNNDSTTENISNLVAGTYCLTINNNGCLFDTCFVISEPDILGISFTDTDVFCNGYSNAYVISQVSGGTLPYSYTWTKDGQFFSSDANIDSIGSGVYCLNVIDSNGCTISSCDTIFGPQPLTILGQVEHLSCYNGTCDGSVEAIVSGGTPGTLLGETYNYQYRINSTSTGLSTPWQTDSVFSDLCVGTYSIEVMDYYECISAYPDFDILEPDSFVISAVIIDETCDGCSDGSIDLTVTGGELQYIYNWSNGGNTQEISNLGPGEYSVTILDLNGCSDSASFTINSIPNPGWTITESEIIHNILFDDTASAYIDCSPFVSGDFIGVFYDDAGNLACGGYFMWNGNSVLMVIYGDDPLVTGKSGFYINEEFQWKAWRAVDSTLFDLQVNYITGNPLFPDQNYFVANGASWAENAFSIHPQILNLPLGWSMFSINTNPVLPDIEDLFIPVSSNLMIIKNGNGLMYWPAFALNIIGNVIIGEGYQINMFYPDTLYVYGTCLWPEITPVHIKEGWSMIGYLRRSPALIDVMLAPVQSNVIIIKSDLGFTYWPYFGLNLIGDMLPGKGYQIKMSVQDTLFFPPNDTIYLNN